MTTLSIVASASVNPTEDETKVERALHNIFPAASIQRTRDADENLTLTVRGIGFEFLNTFRSLIKQDRIRAAARSILIRHARGERIQVYLNKQAAFVGRISFCEPVGESPLGPITIKVECSSPTMVIDWLAPNIQGNVNE